MGNLRIATHGLRLARGGGIPSPGIAEAGGVALQIRDDGRGCQLPPSLGAGSRTEAVHLARRQGWIA